MLIIKFSNKRYTDRAQGPVDSSLYAIDSDGRMTMHPKTRKLPEDEAFNTTYTFVGIAKLTDKKLLYKLEDITPDLLKSGIEGLSTVPTYSPKYTVIVNDLERDIAWSRGIEKIYFSDY